VRRDVDQNLSATWLEDILRHARVLTCYAFDSFESISYRVVDLKAVPHLRLVLQVRIGESHFFFQLLTLTKGEHESASTWMGAILAL